MTDVVSMLHHRQSCVDVDPDIFDMAFEGNVMIANSQVVLIHNIFKKKSLHKV